MKSKIAYLHEIPFVRLLLPFIIGIVFSIKMNAYLPLAWGLIACFFSVSVLLKLYLSPTTTHHWFGASLHLLFFLIGYQVCYEYDERKSALHFSTQLEKSSKVIIKITQIPTSDKWSKFEAKVLSIDKKEANGNLLVYLKEDTLAQPLKYGDVLILNSYIQPVSPPKNPEQFNYQSYLHFKNLHYQTFAQLDEWKLVDENQGNFFFSVIYKWRKNAIQTLEKYLSPKNYSVGAALILGYREALSDEVQEAYADTGAIHVLAVSGLHVGIIVGILKLLLGFFFKKVKRFRFLQPVIIICCLWIFAFLTGGSPSVLRATTMFTFVTIGLYIKHPSSIYNNLAVSAFLLLLIDPYFIQSVGFQLSYMAVLGIVYFQPKVYKLLYVPTKLGNYFWTLTTVAIGAQIGTLPLSLYYFHQFPILFFISGLIVIPTAALILSLGLFTLFFEMWFPKAAELVAYVLDGVIQAVNWTIFMLKDIPFHKVEHISLSVLGLMLLLAMIIMIVYWIQTNSVKSFVAVLSIALIISVLSAFKIYNNHQQNTLIAYHIYKQTAIEVINGKNAVTFFSNTTDTSAYQFASENFHIKKGIKSHKILSIADTLQSSNLFFNGSILYSQGKTVFILSKKTEWKKLQNVKTDYVFICGNPFLKIEELITHVKSDQIIFDASNSVKSVNFWKKECEQLKMNYHNIHEEGAWILDF